ncbi:MAG: glycoside hydrolase family 9 protein [Devosia sp.]
MRLPILLGALGALIVPGLTFGSPTTHDDYRSLTVDAFSSFYPRRAPGGGWTDADGSRDALTGAVAIGQMFSAFRRASRASEPDPMRDGELRIAEHGNHLPDLLDEARFELEWLASLTITDGVDAGLLRAGSGDGAEASIPATLAFAAVASAASRYYARFDRAFIDRMRKLAIDAYAAARARPGADDGANSGAFYWAAAELLTSSGKAAYLADLKASPHWTGDVFAAPPGPTNLAPFGRLLLARESRQLSAPDAAAIRQSVVAGADMLLAQPGEAEAPFVRAQDGILLASAFDISGHAIYRAAAFTAMDGLPAPDAPQAGAPPLIWNAALGQLASWAYEQR